MVGESADGKKGKKKEDWTKPKEDFKMCQNAFGKSENSPPRFILQKHHRKVVQRLISHLNFSLYHYRQIFFSEKSYLVCTLQCAKNGKKLHDNDKRPNLKSAFIGFFSLLHKPLLAMGPFIVEKKFKKPLRKIVHLFLYWWPFLDFRHLWLALFLFFWL